MQGGLQHDFSSTLLTVPHNRVFAIMNDVTQDTANLRENMRDLCTFKQQSRVGDSMHCQCVSFF
jgi:hypothetical protein